MEVTNRFAMSEYPKKSSDLPEFKRKPSFLLLAFMGTRALIN